MTTAVIDPLAEFNSILEEWNRDHGSSSSNQLPRLTRLAEIVEKETEAYFKMDPDPFDDRHPGRAFPACILGQLMKIIFKNEEFMNKLVISYMMGPRESVEMHTAACRLLLDVLPGMETSVVFQETESLVDCLCGWVENGREPLCYYATGMLAGAMELQDVAAAAKEKNNVLVPLLLERLHQLRHHENEESASASTSTSAERPFSMFSKTTPLIEVTNNDSKTSLESIASIGTIQNQESTDTQLRDQRLKKLKRGLSPSYYSEDLYRLNTAMKKPRHTFAATPDCSNNSWAEMEPYVIGSYSMVPLTTGMKQRLILRYLIPMGEYQELLGVAFEHSALDLILYYINLHKNKDVRLAFEGLKYLATLLCHKKFAIAFLGVGGVERLLKVYRPSIAATGVSLCLYYLSYFENSMERVCLLPDHVLSDLVGYVMWLMECSHDSSRCHAAMFFQQAFPFRVILELFDHKDGLRCLFNVISTLEILNSDHNSSNFTDDHVFTMRQAARHVSSALKKYFESHLIIKTDEIRHSHLRNDGASLHDTPAYKPLKLTANIVQENMELLMELLPYGSHWLPDETFQHLGGVKLLTQIVAMAVYWNGYPGKSDTLKSALDVIALCMVSPKSQLLLLENIDVQQNTSTPAISVIVGMAEGELMADPDVQRAALTVIVNCVCGPIERIGGGVGRFMGAGSKKKINWKGGEDTLTRMWNAIRADNGIMVLLKLLSIKTPITDADSIRALACKALVGMSRSETVRQIISKLPFFQNGTLQMLMKEPVLQDRRQEHMKFCKFASDLLERVSGKHSNILDASLEDIRKADIVAQTKIIFQERELLQLMYNHLVSKGFVESATSLQREAGLPRCSTPPVIIPASMHLFSSPSTPRLSRQLSQSPLNPSVYSPGTSTQNHSPPGLSSVSPGPIRFSLNRPQQSVHTPATHKLSKASKFAREKVSQPLSSGRLKSLSQTGCEYNISLNKIVTEYLRKQHALCRSPVVTCPPMSLFTPHRCPEPKGRTSAPLCISSRLKNREIRPRFGGIDGARCNRKYIYNRFRPARTYRDGEEDGFACCAFSANEQYLMLGTFSGEIKLTSILTGEQVESFTCHSAPIIHIEPSWDGRLLLTSAWGTMQDSSLWSLGDTSVGSKFTFADHYAEFSKVSQDRIVGTSNEYANLYDVTTGHKIVKLYDADKVNNYKTNMATFSPTDDLVLNDGVLWDIRTPTAIHKFDKFNWYISGVFNPTGLEIIINSEVWDVRTFRLLNTVPALDQCQIKFNHTGDIMYATRVDEDPDDPHDRYRSPYGSTLRTFDATDYSSIGTMDLKTKSIFDLATDKSDCYLAVVESQQFSESGADESICRLYEVGKLRDEDDDLQDEEEEEDQPDDDDDDGDDDDFSNIDVVDLGSEDDIGQYLGDLEELDDNGDDDDNDDEDDDIEFSIGSDNDVLNFNDDDVDDDEDDGEDIDDDTLFQLV